MTFGALPGNLARVRQQIAAVQAREGVAQAVRIVAVTKGHGPDGVRAALAAGLLDVGENRIQEAVGKHDELADLGLHWHLIGHLQTNKARYVPGRFHMVHSVDSVRVANALDRAARSHGAPGTLAVLVQVNVSGEAQKAGCLPEAAGEIAARAAELPTLDLKGLMTMAPLTNDETLQRSTFRRLRLLRERLEREGFAMPELSMGMSDDYLAAVAEGATIVRLGTVLLGQRAA
jgi:pyridoxal phosphate enzyme (YggS family)